MIIWLNYYNWLFVSITFLYLKLHWLASTLSFCRHMITEEKAKTYLQRSNIAISKSKDMWTNTNLFCWPHFLLVYECGMSFVLFSYGTGSRNYRNIEKAFHVRLLDSGCMLSFLTESCWSNHRFLSISFIWFVREIKGSAEIVV